MNRKEGCIFCGLADAGGPELLHENRLYYARINPFPVVPGHALVIPKSHVAELKDVNLLQMIALVPVVIKTMKLLKETDLNERYGEMLDDPLSEISTSFILDALRRISLVDTYRITNFNHGINDGPDAEQSINHLHWHIIPRTNEGVELDAKKGRVGGVLNMIPGKGDYTKG